MTKKHYGLTGDEYSQLVGLLNKGNIVASIDEDDQGFHRVQTVLPSTSGKYLVLWLDGEPEPLQDWGLLP